MEEVGKKGWNHRQTGMWGPLYENTNQGLVSQSQPLFISVRRIQTVWNGGVETWPSTDILDHHLWSLTGHGQDLKRIEWRMRFTQVLQSRDDTWAISIATEWTPSADEGCPSVLVSNYILILCMFWICGVFALEKWLNWTKTELKLKSCSTQKNNYIIFRHFQVRQLQKDLRKQKKVTVKSLEKQFDFSLWHLISKVAVRHLSIVYCIIFC